MPTNRKKDTRRLKHGAMEESAKPAGPGESGPTEVTAPLNRRLALVAAVLFLATAVYLGLGIPMGIPGQWCTPYHTLTTPAADIAFLALVLAGFALLAFAFDRVSQGAGAAGRAAMAAALTVAYGLVLFTTASTGPYGRAEFIVPSAEKASCGLFRYEAQRITNWRDYLARFPQILEAYRLDYRKTVKVNNNPPGTTMVFYVSSKLAQRYPRLADASVKAVFGNGFTAPTERLAEPLIGSWMLLFGTMLAFVPAYLSASLMYGGRAFFPAAAGMLAGSLLLFNPDNDTLQVMPFLWMFYFALKGMRGRPLLWGALMGITAAAAFFFTLATAIVVIVLFAWTAALKMLDRKRSIVQDAMFWAASAAGLAAGFGILYATLRYNSLSSLYVCYTNHREFYTTFHLVYWQWVLYNVWDFAMFFGGPLVAVVGWYAIRKPAGQTLSGEDRTARAFILAALVVMLVLDISGKNLSEVNRLWVFFMPLLALPALVVARRDKHGAGTLWAVVVMQVLTILMMRAFVDLWLAESLFKHFQEFVGS